MTDLATFGTLSATPLFEPLTEVVDEKMAEHRAVRTT
jgi:hypothetical protein